MTKRFVLVLSSAILATLLLLALTAFMTPWNRIAVQAAPASKPQPAPVALPPAAPLQQTTTTPTYVISDSVTGGVAYDWVEISGSGTPYFGGNDWDNWGSVEADIGFYFPFYDNVYRTLRASSNGYIYFDGTRPDGAPTPLFVGSPSAPNNFIAPFGANLYLYSGVSQIYVEQLITRTVVEFVDAQWCCGLNDPHTFEVILYRDGRILTQYRQVRYATNPNERVVAGIENADGSDGIAYYQNWFQEDTSLDDGLAVLYDPGDSIFGHIILDPPIQVWWDDPGRTGNFGVTLFNLSGVSDTFELTYSLQISSSVVPTASRWPVDVPAYAAFTISGTETLSESVSNLGESTFQVTATIPITAGWWDVATLYVTASATSSPTISNTVAITHGVAQRDLQVEKNLFPDEAPAPGGDFRYRVTVTNGPYPGSNRAGWARDVRVTDTLPFSATWLGFDPSAGSAGTLAIPGFRWDVGDLAPNGSEYLDVYMRVPSSVPTGTVLTNTAWTATWDSVERGPFDNNKDVHTTTVTASRLVFNVGKEFPGPDPDEIGQGQIALYDVNVINAGNVPITGTVVTDVLPIGTTFYTTTWPTATLLADNRTLVFTIGTVLNGDWNARGFQVSISVPVTTPVGTWLTNTVQVTTTAPLDGFTLAQGDSDVEVIQVIDPRGDVAVNKVPETFGGFPVTPEAGGDYTFWISYTNRGYGTVYTVTLTDTLPLSYVVLLEAGPAGTAQPDTSAPGQVVWHISDIAPGATGWTRVRILIDENTPPGTPLINTVEITAAAGLNITTTNDTSAVTIILDAADVTIDKQVAPAGTLSVGDWVTYTVRYTNTGVLAAAGVRITDVLPSELTNASWISGSHPIEALVEAPPLLVWRTTQPLDAGDSGMVVITAQLDPGATWPPQALLTNRVEIQTATREEPDDDPNTAQASNVVAYASPYVIKTGPTLALSGELITYTIEYGNGGLLVAEDVCLTDTLPVSTTYVADTSPGFTVTTGADWVAWEAGTISGDTTGLTFTLVVSVSPDAPAGTSLENTIALASSTYDGSFTDNESTWIMPLGFDLSNSYKQVNEAAGAWVGSGTPVTYTIVLTNRGPSTATSVSLRDPTPGDTVYITNSFASSAGTGGYDPAGDAITWTGIVSGYTRITVTFQVTVAAAGPLPRDTVITNTAFISDSIQVLQVSAPITITGPDLGNSYKTVNEFQPSPGERITYTIVLENNGESDALGASVLDDLPSSYIIYTGDGWPSSGSLGSGDPITWTGTVARGGRVTITLPVTVVAGPGNHFANTARIDDGTGEEIQRSVTVSTTRPILKAEKAASAAALVSGERVTYTIAVTNSGNGWAYSARVTDTIQGGTYVSSEAQASGGAFDFTDPPTIVWTGPLAPSGGNVVITIPVVITATPGSDVDNVAQVDDGYGAILDVSTSIHVYSAGNIVNSTKEVNRTEARNGETLVYTLTVDNAGELDTAFSVVDTLDPGTTFDTFVGSPPGSYGHVAGTITWTGAVSGSSQVQLSFQATIDAGASGMVTNTAHFSGAGEITPTAITRIIVPAALTATKSVDPVAPVVAGEYLTYTIVMTNVGGDAGRASFTDTIPTHTEYVGGSARASSGPPPIYDSNLDWLTWQGDLAPDETVTLTFRVWVTPGTVTGTTIANVAWLQELNEPGPLFSVTATNTTLSPVFTATKQAHPSGGVLLGKPITYTIVVTNVGAGTARVIVTDTIPTHTTCIISSIQVYPATHDLPTCVAGVLSWQGDIDAHSFARLAFAVSQNITVGKVISNSAQVQELSQPTEIVTVYTTNTVVAPVLSAGKRVEPSGAVFAGTRLTYTVVMSNSGNAPAQVSFSDPLPAHTTYITAHVFPATYNSPVYVAPTLTWSDAIAPDEAVTLTINVLVDPGTVTGTTISNVAWFQELGLPGPLFSAGVTNTVRSPVYSAVKRSTPVTDVHPGAVITYDIVLANQDLGIARVVLTDTIPDHTAYVTTSAQASSGSPPTYDPDHDRLTWRGDVAAHNTVTLTFAVTVELDTGDGEAISNVARLQESSQPGVVTISATNRVVRPLLDALKLIEPVGTVYSGDVLTYTIAMTNAGGSPAQVSFSDEVPSYTTYIAGSAYISPATHQAPVYHPVISTLTWEDSIAPYSAAILTFRAQVDPGTPAGVLISNVAWIDELSDPAGAASYSVVNTVAGQGVYLPIVLRNH
jgi:uncharacterized repeat protein (TIGR01451 family)